MEIKDNINFPQLFNSPLETGIRAVVVLEAFYPRACNISELTWFDHLVVHTGDFGNGEVPESIHPALPNRTGELLVRRGLVEESLKLMQVNHLIEVMESENGIHFSASEDAPFFLDLLRAPYTIQLKERAQWLASTFANMSSEEINKMVSKKIGRWTAEFMPNEDTGGLEL